MMPLTQRRYPARAPHQPEHRTGPSTAPTRAATPFSLELQGLPAQSACRTQACSSTVYMELRVVAFFRMRQIWSCADPGFGERSKFRANQYRGLPSTVNTESLEPASRPAQQIWSMRDVPTPSAANRELRHGERCKSGVIGTPSAAHLELSSASAADRELRPPAEAVNSISAALDADNSIFAALGESRPCVTPDMQR